MSIISLRLRRALAAAPLLRPSAAASPFSSPSRPLLPSLPRSSAPPPRHHPHPLFFLPGAAAGFRSTAAAAAARGGVEYGDEKISPDEILFEGCDFNHWLITMEFPDPKPSREEMIETYLQTIAKVVGSYEEAKKRMYAFSTTTYVGFQVLVTEEMSEKFRGLPGVVFILPDSYLYPETKEYGGDQYDNGVITPKPPPVTYSRPSRTDRNRNYRGNYQDGPPPQGNYQNSPPQQGNYRNSPPQQGNFQNGPPQQGNFQNNPPRQGNFQTYPSQQDGRGYAPQQNYAQAGQDGRGYVRNDNADRSGYNRPPGGYQSEATQYQGHANPAVQGQGFYNPQERRNLPQEQAGDFKPGGPSAPGYGQPSATGTYGQPPATGNFGQPPTSTYPGSNQGGPGVNPGLQGTGPANGGDNWQGGSGQYPSRGEGQQGHWQGRQ